MCNTVLCCTCIIKMGRIVAWSQMLHLRLLTVAGAFVNGAVPAKDKAVRPRDTLHVQVHVQATHYS
jgi:hypothetical protein